MGTIATHTLSIELEKTLGDVMRRQLRAQAPIVYDPLVNEYLNDLGNRLVSKASDVKYPFYFYALEQNSINAFATFGGTIVVHTQTLVESQSESEFASVVAHEIAHVTQRHIARKGEMQQRNSAANIAALLGSVLVTMINPNVGMAALMTTQGAQQQMVLNYTRHHEKEADRIGLQTLVASGFDPRGAESFFGRMAEQQRYSTKLPPMLYSHPLPENRMADIKSRVDGMPIGIYSQNIEYNFVRTRVIARHTLSPDYHEKSFRHDVMKLQGVDKVVAQYGLAIALVDQKKYQESKQILTSLLKLDPSNLHFVDAMTDTLIGLKEFESAYEMLEKYRAQRPTNQVVVLNYANALNYGKRYKEAIELLKDYLLLNPEQHLAWQLITESYKGAEMSSQYHQAKAEVLAQKLGYQQAIDELHTAHNHTPKDNTADRKRISARIKQLREEITKLEKL
ncbi:hypothetical protein C2869_01455 [Saccharobesus litoralis]|uniref:Putative beta-barrel assembly-enhancing protease n=2 Tax=Saccharobesus litoralis TaxID=2172099 RepID=A0A2S0VXM6_9ALTE|nr:hypothetical protein C2869_01455 [Saccharobesus litoralis]